LTTSEDRTLVKDQIDDNGIIRFDDEYFFNKKGIEALGFSSSDCEAIYNYLIAQHRMSDGSKGLVFYNSVTHLRDFSWEFTRKGIKERIPFEWNQLYDYLRVFKNSLFGGYTYYPVKLVGFFEIEKPYRYKGHSFSRLKPVHHAYANKIKIEGRLPIQVHTDNLVVDESRNYYLPRTHSQADLHSRINTEFYFSDQDLTSACYIHFHEFDIDSVELPLCTTYEAGKMVNKDIISENDDTPNESPRVIATLERIVAGLFWVLQNERHPKFKDRTAIYNHLEKHFDGIPGLNMNYIKEFIKRASDELKEREIEQGFEETYLEKVKKMP